MEKYLKHLLNDYEFISQIEMGTPKQKVEVVINYWDDYLTILSDTTTLNPYFYNESSSYTELIKNDPQCNLKVYNSYTIKEILYLKNKFYDNLNDFISSNDEYSHEFIIIFSKLLPILRPGGKYTSGNTVNIGLLTNTKYNKDHGIYNPFLLEIQEHNFTDKQVHFLYFFDEYKDNLYTLTNNSLYDGLIVFGNFPHEIYPDKFDEKNLYLTDTFLTEDSDYEEIEWGIKFDKIYLEDPLTNKTINEEILKGVFDYNIEYIFIQF